MMYREYNEMGYVVRESENLGWLIEDTKEFGGCVTDFDGNFAGGSEWVYEEIKGRRA